MQCILDAWKAHETELIRFLCHRAGDEDTARDMLQEVFLRALRRPQGLCDVADPRAWLFHAARNLLIDRYRLSKDQVSLPDNLPASQDTGPAPVDALSDCLPRVLGELAEQDQQAIQLCDIQGLSDQAYADKQGLSLSAAKSRLRRARQHLRRHLETACQVRYDETGQVCCFIPRAPL